MDRGQPGYTVPCMRRLEHLQAITVRNLHVPGAGDAGSDELPDTFFTLDVELPADDDAKVGARNVCVYRSELARHTCNPGWIPMEWDALPAFCDSEDDARAVVLASSVQLTVWSVPASHTRAPDHADDDERDAETRAHHEWRSRLSAAEYMPDAALPAHVRACFRVSVSLPEMHFLGFDIFDALVAVANAPSSMSVYAASYASRAGREGARDVLPPGLPPEALSFALDALPVNTLIFVLDDGHYMLQETIQVLLRSELSSSSGAAWSPSLPSASSAGVHTHKHDLRRGFDVVNRLVQLSREMEAAKHATRGYLESMAKVSHSAQQDGVGEAEARVLAKAVRVAALRERKAALAAEVAEAEQSLAARRAAATSRVAHVRKAVLRLRDAATVLPAMELEVQAVREEVSLLKNLLSAKQLALVAELRALYPILELEPMKRYSIRGLELPDRDLHTYPEEQVSTALGYTCHLVSLLSKYLQVPLRFYPQPLGSRSSMRDEVLNHTAEYPLYFKAVEQHSFYLGVLMLSRSVRQLMASQGIATTGSGTAADAHMLANLARLFTVLLDVPLPAPDPAVAAPPRGVHTATHVIAAAAAHGAANAAATATGGR